MKIRKIKRGDNYGINNKYGENPAGSMKNKVISIDPGKASSRRPRLAVQKDHDEAVRTFAVESYLLSEMPEEEQVRFEQHCVECKICAEAVEAGRILIMNILPTPQAAPSTPWFEGLFKVVATGPWLKQAVAMAALWLPVLGWQQATISDLMGAHANTAILARAIEKGRAEKSPYSLTTASATIELCLQQDPPFPFYKVEVAGGHGKSFSQVVPAPPQNSGGRVSVQVLRSALGNGHFAVLVEGLEREDAKNGRKLDDVYVFDLK